MEYTGTRLSTQYKDGYNQLSGPSGTYVSNRLNDTASGQTASFSNAGACTVQSA
jgi:hypothetical protein